MQTSRGDFLLAKALASGTTRRRVLRRLACVSATAAALATSYFGATRADLPTRAQPADEGPMGDRHYPPPDLSRLRPVPGDFLWGAATAGVQVEGNLPFSEWARFVALPGDRGAALERIAARLGLDLNRTALEPFGDAVRHYDTGTADPLRYVCADLDRAVAIGLSAYRFSVEWSRVQPGPGPIDPDGPGIGYYRGVARAVIERGMTPVVTLNHLSLPVWVLSPPQTMSPFAEPDFLTARGWGAGATVDRFLAFARAVVPALLEEGVRLFITFNEPVATLIGAGYVAGAFPPGLVFFEAGAEAAEAHKNILRAHNETYELIKGLVGGTETQVGLAAAILHVVPAAPDDDQAASQFDYFVNHHMLDTVVFGRSPDRWAPSDAVTTLQAGWSPRLDFIGVNYYRRVQVYRLAPLARFVPFWGGAFDPDMRRSTLPHGLLTELGWEISPGGLYHQLRALHDRYRDAFAAVGRPLRVLVTENGLGEGADADRAPHLVAHLQYVLAARDEGVDVFGYLYWSLLDNWEWIEGYRPEARFGLFSVRRDRPEQPRFITEGAVALNYLTTAGIDGAAERFGVLDGNGIAVAVPTGSPGRLYAGVLNFHDRTDRLELYLSIQADGSPLGLLYYRDRDLWVRLERVHYRDANRTVLRFTHRGVRGTVASGHYEIEATELAAPPAGEAVATRIIGRAEFVDEQGATVGRGTLAAQMRPLGLYRVPGWASLPPRPPVAPPARSGAGSDPGLFDGTRGMDGTPWAPLIITGYQDNLGFSNAKQLNLRWHHVDVTIAGDAVTMRLLVDQAVGEATRGRPFLVEQPLRFSGPVSLRFTGTALVHPSGETVFERITDGVGLGG